jgi:hypothetical protein
MDAQVDGVFRKMVSLLQLMKQTGQADPSNPKIAIELQKYERELYLNLRDYGALLRRFLQMDKAQAEELMAKQDEITRMRRELDEEEFDLSWDAAADREIPTMENMAPARPPQQDTIPSISQGQPQAANPSRPIPPRTVGEERAPVRPRSASEILSQLHGTSAEGV